MTRRPRPFRSRAAALLLGALVLCAPAQGQDRATSDAQGDDMPLLRLADSTSDVPDLAFFRADGGSAGGGVRRELIGLVINGREQPDGLAVVISGGQRHLPLAPLAPLLGISLVVERENLVLRTPIGPTRLSLLDVAHRGGDYFVDPQRLAQAIAADIAFDDAEFALRVRLSWDPQRGPGGSELDPIRPDNAAPTASLSRLRGEVLVEHDDLRSQESGFLEAFGRLAGGTWQGRYRREPDGSQRLHDYQWQRRHGDWAGLIGHQFVGAHSLLNGMELAGVQMAWSDRPERLLAPVDPGRLVADYGGPVRDVRGEGPPGGVAELLIDGVSVDRQRIPLDGVFEFRNVDVPAGFVRIEVAVYGPFALGAPEQVLDFSGQASDRLLPAGGTVIHGGVGQEGNPLDERSINRGAAAFLSGRRGITAGLTVEAAAQRSDVGTQGVVGVAADLGPVGIAHVAHAQEGSASARMLTLDGEAGRAFWRASLRDQDAEFGHDTDSDRVDRYAEAGWRHWPRWEVSVIARQREGLFEDVDFVKPALRVRPWNNLVLQSRPDSDGHYVHDLSWQVSRRTRFGARQDRAFRHVGVDHRWSERWQSSVSLTEDRFQERSRASAVVSWQDGSVFGWYADVGVLAGEGETGFLLRAGRELRPGLRLRVEAQRDPLFEQGYLQRGTVAMAALSFDLGRAGGGFTRAGGTRAGTGSIGGHIAGAAGDTGLDGIAVRIDGQTRARTDAQGRFHITDMAPGVYRVSLDEEGLPMEWSPQQDGFWVEVADGGATQVAFAVAMRLGAAGRLLQADGSPAGEGTVEVLDADGRVRARAHATAFGYFRVDGLAPGAYTLRWLDDRQQTVAQRDLRLTEGFLFGQDLRADALPSTQPGTDRMENDDATN